MSQPLNADEQFVFDAWAKSLPGPVIDAGTCYNIIIQAAPLDPLSISINKGARQ